MQSSDLGRCKNLEGPKKGWSSGNTINAWLHLEGTYNTTLSNFTASVVSTGTYNTTLSNYHTVLPLQWLAQIGCMDLKIPVCDLYTLNRNTTNIV